MHIEEPFDQHSYENLERQMKTLAEANGDVYLPNAEPTGRAHYVLICMEPSLGRWARNRDQAESKIESGFRNFLSSIEDFILHFAVRQYLCSSEQRYHITDLSKGAMLVKGAASGRTERYDGWYQLLEQELDLCATRNAHIVAVGKLVWKHLVRRDLRWPITPVMHYSGQAAPARRAGIRGHEDRFESFRNSVTLDDVLAAADATLTAANVPSIIRDQTMSRLRKSQLTTSRQELIFNYKRDFESIRTRSVVGSADTLGSEK
jgi:hypothetical protein